MKFKYWGTYFLIFLIYVLLIPRSGFFYDLRCWSDWTEYIFNNGLENVYKSLTDYLPVLHYILYIFGKILGSVESIGRNVYLLKAITLMFDFVAGFYLIKLISIKINSPIRRFYLSLFYFLNIPMLYNTLIWGQVDGILAAFIFISVYYAIKKRILPTIIFFILALNFKLQAIVFFPLIALLILPEFVKRITVKNFLIWTGTIIGFQFLILAPFIFNGDFDLLMLVVRSSINKFPMISMNAYNFWYWFFQGNLMIIPDSGLFRGYTFKEWGLILFFLTSFLALLPLILHTGSVLIKKKTTEFPIDKIMIIGALIPLLFFFFNTQMHERYSHPALVFIIAFSILNKNFLAAGFICIAYLLNMEDVCRFLHLHNYQTLLFNEVFISILYFIGILLLFFELYNLKLLRTSNSHYVASVS